MINFVVKEKKQDTEFDKLRRKGMVITTAILAVYIVIMAGFLGWSWYWSGKEKAMGIRYQNLLTEVASRAEAEVVVRKLDSRVKSGINFLDSRGSASASAASFNYSGVVVVGWDYAPGVQIVTVKADSKQTILDFAGYLSGIYTQVQYDEIVWNSDYGWQAAIRLGGAPS